MTPAPADALLRLLHARPGRSPAEDLGATVAGYLADRDGWYAPVVGPLVLPDSALTAASRQLAGRAELEVSVTVGGGAGGLVALASLSIPGLRVSAAESTLRDLDDLAASAGRVVVAAGELAGVDVYIGLPAAPGWVHAVEVVEAAGHYAALSPARWPAADPAAARELAEQLSVLVEADLPFRVGWPPAGASDPAEAAALATVGLLMAVEALVDGADPTAAAALLSLTDRGRARAGLTSWDAATAARVRRRLRAVATEVAPLVRGLVGLGLLTGAGPDR